MTFVEFIRLIRKFWIVCVLIPVACAVACAGWLFLLAPAGSASGGSYSAVGRVVVNTQLAIVNGHASSAAREYAAHNSEYSASAKSDSASMTVAITVTGPDADKCVSAVNSISAYAVTATEADFAEAEESEYKTPFRSQIEKAQVSEKGADSKQADSVKYLVASLLGGLVIALCVIAIIDIRKRYVKSAEGVQEIAGVPVLEVLPVSDGSRLLANIRFAAENDEVSSLCVISLPEAMSGNEIKSLLEAAAEKDMRVAVYSAGTNEVPAYYAARESDAVLIAVCELKDDLRTLGHVVSELKLAKANLIGFVYAKK